MVRRITGMTVGVVYAVAYGFWTMLITGGGHANFLWMIAFFVTFFFGLFFPMVGFLVVDLKPLWARRTLLGILFFNLFATVLFFYAFLPGDGQQDVVASWRRSPGLFVFSSALHCLPLVILWVLTLRNLGHPDNNVKGTYK